MRFWLILFMFSLSSFAFAQDSDEKLAAQYLSEGEYDKAEILYQKLHKKDRASVYIYQNYLECLVALKDFNQAEKTIEKQIKKYPNRPNYSVDLGYIYSLTGNDKAKKELYENLIDETIDQIKQNQASTALGELLAASFLKRDEYAYAKSALLKTRKASGNPVLFAQNLIELYRKTGDYEEVVDECLLMLNYNFNALEMVQANLIYLVDEDIKIDYLQERSATYLQKYPEKQVFDDLLYWVFVQQKKFMSAYRQALSMDKKRQTEGKYLIDLAATCLSNNEYDVAIQCYDKVVGFGLDGFFYRNAVIGSLETGYRQLNANSTSTSVDALVLRFESTLESFGKNPDMAPAMKWLSDLYIYHKHELDKGISLLQEVVDMPRLRHSWRGEYKLALGDAYLMKNEVWDATLLYGQVDKDFKEDPLGQEAKFRNARLSYFQGDFDWAKDQLDVLKTATSQLISNNAIELSLLIKDNTGLDSNEDAMKLFAKAQLLLFQNKLDESLKILNLLPIQYPNHALEDEIYLTKAQVFERQLNYDRAEEYYLNVIKYFSNDILADNAVFGLAKMYEEKLQNTAKAVEMYEKLIMNYHSSLFVVEARKRYKYLLPKLEQTP